MDENNFEGSAYLKIIKEGDFWISLKDFRAIIHPN